MTNNDLRFRVNLNAYDKQLTIKDTNTWTGENQAVLLKVTNNTLGLVVYENGGFDLGDYSKPDIVVGVSDSFTFDLPLDSDSNIPSGEYLVEYKVKEIDTVSPTAASGKITRLTAKTLQIVFSTGGDAAAVYESGLFACEEVGVNDFLIKISDYTYTSGTFTLVITSEEDISADIDDCDSMDVPVTFSTYTTSNTFDYCYTRPTIGIEMTSTCSQSVLTSEDTTDYNAENHNTNYFPTTLTREHSLAAPHGSSYTGSLTPTTAAKVTLLPNIWTGVWQSTVTTDLEYSIKRWSNTDTTYWFFIYDTVEGYETHDVKCTTCYCELYNCTVKLYNDFVRSLSSNPKDSKYYLEAVVKMNNLWMQYQMGVACGENTDSICDAMAVILSDNDCHCTIANHEVSKEIIPVSQIYGDSTGSQIYFGTDPTPSSGLGKDSDTYIVDSTMVVYYKTNGAWENKGTMKGDNGTVIRSGSGAPDNEVGVNGDFYLRTSNGVMYKKTAGVYESDATLKGADGIDGTDGNDGDAATITVGTVTYSNESNIPKVENSGTSSDAILDFTFPNPMTPEQFNLSYNKPVFRSISGVDNVAYSNSDAIKVTYIDRGNKKIRFNHIPHDVIVDVLAYKDNVDSTTKKWTVWSFNQTISSVSNHNSCERFRIVDVNEQTREITYDITYGGGGAYDTIIGSVVSFNNPFANIDFVRKTFMLNTGETIDGKLFKTHHPNGITKKEGVYRYFSFSYYDYFGSTAAAVVVHEGADETVPVSTSPYDILYKSDFESALGTTISPKGFLNINSFTYAKSSNSYTVTITINSGSHDFNIGDVVFLRINDTTWTGEDGIDGYYEIASVISPTQVTITTPYFYASSKSFTTTNGVLTKNASNDFAPLYIRNIDDETIEMYYSTHSGNGSTCYIFELNHDLQISNIREYTLKMPFGYHSGSNLGNCTYINGKYIFGYFDMVDPYTPTGWKLYEFIIDDDEIRMSNRVYYPHITSYDGDNYIGEVFTTQHRFCDYKGLKLCAYHTRSQSKYTTGGTIGLLATALGYIDENSETIKELSPNNVLTYPHEFSASNKIFGTDLGYDHTGSAVLFYDKDEDILFVYFTETKGTNTYSTAVGRFKFKS